MKMKYPIYHMYVFEMVESVGSYFNPNEEGLYN